MNHLTDYAAGIAYATGYLAKENEKNFLFVRNVDPHYAKIIADESGYRAYKSTANMKRDGKPQWCVKAKSIGQMPKLNDVCNAKDFIRAYIEIHATIDYNSAKDRKGNKIKRLRLRIFGCEEVLTFINTRLPAEEKKIQYIKNVINKNSIGRTRCIYYQSRKEIFDILNWIDGTPKNEKVWNNWKETIDSQI